MARITIASPGSAGTGVALIADDLPRLTFSMPLSRRSAQSSGKTSGRHSGYGSC
ncbi:hypothetical protein [Polaromonas sp.]|uniref:hypothetical protein n=1 Tax=Polaromonas sp. TaxID=1869339 RepID=UPI0017C86BDB|nr:hypothetical protein [Polaromonas sp.]NML85985.1 hypothetical protein [Polaromonas sp.]